MMLSAVLGAALALLRAAVSADAAACRCARPASTASGRPVLIAAAVHSSAAAGTGVATCVAQERHASVAAGAVAVAATVAAVVAATALTMHWIAYLRCHLRRHVVDLSALSPRQRSLLGLPPAPADGPPTAAGGEHSEMRATDLAHTDGSPDTDSAGAAAAVAAAATPPAITASPEFVGRFVAWSASDGATATPTAMAAATAAATPPAPATPSASTPATAVTPAGTAVDGRALSPAPPARVPSSVAGLTTAGARASTSPLTRSPVIADINSLRRYLEKEHSERAASPDDASRMRQDASLAESPLGEAALQRYAGAAALIDATGPVRYCPAIVEPEEHRSGALGPDRRTSLGAAADAAEVRRLLDQLMIADAMGLWIERCRLWLASHVFGPLVNRMDSVDAIMRQRGWLQLQTSVLRGYGAVSLVTATNIRAQLEQLCRQLPAVRHAACRHAQRAS